MNKTHILFLYSEFALGMFKMNTPSFQKTRRILYTYYVLGRTDLHLLQFKWNRNHNSVPEIKVQSPSKSMTTIPAIPAFPVFHSQRWNGQNRWSTLPVLPIPQKCCIPFTILLFHLFLFLKIIKKNTVLIIFRNTN